MNVQMKIHLLGNNDKFNNSAKDSIVLLLCASGTTNALFAQRLAFLNTHTYKDYNILLR
eukprot:m.12638 g.12638  ORF g.12638 m.12638 type:complete len:59 (-) comp7280_c0_seq1:63-239(-)